MNKDKVAAFQSLERCLGLSLVVGVVKTCSAFDGNAVQPGVLADALNEIHGGDDPAGDAETRGDGFHLRTPPRRPRPDGIGGILSGGNAGAIHGVLREQCLGAFVQLAHTHGGGFGFGAPGAGEQLRFGSAHMIVRGRADQVR